MWSCKYCKKEFNFKRATEKANHTRWCKSNPKRNDTTNLSLAQIKFNEEKLGKLKKFKVKCHNCNSDMIVTEREKQFPKKEKYFCSRSCANSRIISNEIKKKISEKLSKPKIKVKCKNCKKIFEKKKKIQKFCSVECGIKYRSKKALENYDDYKLYRRACEFKFDIKDYPDKFDFELIEKYGWYKAKNRGDNQS